MNTFYKQQTSTTTITIAIRSATSYFPLHKYHCCVSTSEHFYSSFYRTYPSFWGTGGWVDGGGGAGTGCWASSLNCVLIMSIAASPSNSWIAPIALILLSLVNWGFNTPTACFTLDCCNQHYSIIYMKTGIPLPFHFYLKSTKTINYHGDLLISYHAGKGVMSDFLFLFLLPFDLVASIMS